jgi:beta-phosphoglucomutase-like phosphatase (HAD superfamily)
VTDSFKGVIFDIDGVVVDSPHERAWRESLRELMEGRWADIRGQTTWSPDAFTSPVYQQLVSGRPREDGARAALEHFDVPDIATRTAEYAPRKQAALVRLVDAGQFTAYPDAIRFMIDLADRGLLLAAASSSKNIGLMLRRIDLERFGREHGITSPSLRPGRTLLDLFDVDVSGRDFANGKPHPDMFLAAADELGITPAEAVVVEDAPAGITAAAAGGMHSIGVARAGEADLLTTAGADIVVATLDEVDRDALVAGRLAISAA